MSELDRLLTDVPWDFVMEELPAWARPGQLATGMPPRTIFRDEGDTA